MKYILTLICTFLIQTNVIAQSENISKIGDEICKRLNKLNHDEVSNAKAQAMEVIKEGYASMSNEMQKEYISRAKNTPSSSEVEILESIGQDVFGYLLQNCEITHKIFSNTPLTFSPAVTELGGKICDCVDKQVALNNDSAIDYCLDKWTTSEKGISIMEKEIDYDKYEETTAFGEKLGIYLLKDCPIYIERYSRKFKVNDIK